MSLRKQMTLDKQRVIGAGFAFFKATGLHRGLAPLTRGRGAILTLHHVRPPRGGAFAPNRLLDVAPAFLDLALGRIRALGFDLVSLDEALRRTGDAAAAPFVALTFDDGYRDLVDHALPILRRHAAPFTAFITTGFADRTARLWWVELEEAIRASDRIQARIAGSSLPCASAAEKAAAFKTLYWRLRAGGEERLLEVIADLARQAGVDAASLVAERCLDWDGVRLLAREPLCTIGAHTCTHPMLAKHEIDTVRRELEVGRRRLQEATGLPVRHLSYPVGDPTSAGAREFALAAELGFASAVTTRPGMIFPQHRAALHALPRVSLNGEWQSLACLDVLLSGVPFAIWNKGRLVA